jgi:hypothetical protein
METRPCRIFQKRTPDTLFAVSSAPLQIQRRRHRRWKLQMRKEGHQTGSTRASCHLSIERWKRIVISRLYSLLRLLPCIRLTISCSRKQFSFGIKSHAIDYSRVSLECRPVLDSWGIRRGARRSSCKSSMRGDIWVHKPNLWEVGVSIRWESKCGSSLLTRA